MYRQYVWFKQVYDSNVVKIYVFLFSFISSSVLQFIYDEKVVW